MLNQPQPPTSGAAVAAAPASTDTKTDAKEGRKYFTSNTESAATTVLLKTINPNVKKHSGATPQKPMSSSQMRRILLSETGEMRTEFTAVKELEIADLSNISLVEEVNSTTHKQHYLKKAQLWRLIIEVTGQESIRFLMSDQAGLKQPISRPLKNAEGYFLLSEAINSTTTLDGTKRQEIEAKINSGELRNLGELSVFRYGMCDIDANPKNFLQHLNGIYSIDAEGFYADAFVKDDPKNPIEIDISKIASGRALRLAPLIDDLKALPGLAPIGYKPVNWLWSMGVRQERSIFRAMRKPLTAAATSSGGASTAVAADIGSRDLKVDTASVQKIRTPLEREMFRGWLKMLIWPSIFSNFANTIYNELFAELVKPQNPDELRVLVVDRIVQSQLVRLEKITQMLKQWPEFVQYLKEDSAKDFDIFLRAAPEYVMPGLTVSYLSADKAALLTKAYHDRLREFGLPVPVAKVEADIQITASPRGDLKAKQPPNVSGVNPRVVVVPVTAAVTHAAVVISDAAGDIKSDIPLGSSPPAPQAAPVYTPTFFQKYCSCCPACCDCCSSNSARIVPVSGESPPAPTHVTITGVPTAAMSRTTQS